MSKRISPWVMALAGIGMADMLTTTGGILLGHFGELNPTLNWVLTHWGIGGFMLVKTLFVLWPCGLLAWIPQVMPLERRVQIGNTYTIIAICLYLTILTSGLVAQYL